LRERSSALGYSQTRGDLKFKKNRTKQSASQMETIIDVLYNILPVVIEDLVNENTDSDSNSSDSSDNSEKVKCTIHT